MPDDNQLPADVDAASPPISDERMQQVTYVANELCNRVSNRYKLLVAKDLLLPDGRVPVFMCPSERAAYSAACQYLTRLFYSVEP